ncbi:MAG TPA: AIR carboxylase family protein [Candidatus Bathyarchaeia archaeon]|nr:AIR carboxylase family protein [Candidatus Bathyarchaeia archaeon]
MAEGKIVVLLGSISDLAFAHRVKDFLRESRFPVKCIFRINSAHRHTDKLLSDLKGFEQSEDNIVYITMAGLSDALSGVVAGNSKYPVIACPPDLEKLGLPKMFSSMMMPQGIAVSLVSSPENAALLAVKILALSNPSLTNRVVDCMNTLKSVVAKADADLLKKEEHEREREHIERIDHLEHGEHAEHAEDT